jgi:hypothetical protein
VRIAAADALGQLGDVRAVSTLIKALKDPEREVRDCAVKALGQLGEPAVDTLTELLKNSDDFDLSDAAAESLSLIPDQRAVDAVLRHSVARLILLYERSRSGEGFVTGSSAAERVREVGKRLDRMGGFDLMLRAHELFAERRPLAKRNLEMVWDHIGAWLG